MAVRDEQLIQAIRGGDRKAQDSLARRYNTTLYSYFCGRLNRTEAEDFTQMTLLHTVARVERYRQEATFRHYVFSIARRVMFERHRRWTRRVDDEPPPTSEPADSASSLSHRLFREEFHQELMRVLATLPEHYRVVVELHLQGEGNFEIADALGIEYNTVRSRLSRGLAAVKEALAPWVAEVQGKTRN